MRSLLLLLVAALFIAGCTSTTVIKTRPVSNGGQSVVKMNKPAENHTEQGKRMYFKGKYKQAVKHLSRAIAKNQDQWEAHFYLGLCQQKIKRYDRSIGSFNNSLKYCPPDREIIAQLNFYLGKSWEEEGYLAKARDKYILVLKVSPQYAPAKVGLNRIETKSAQAKLKAKKKHKGKKAN